MADDGIVGPKTLNALRTVDPFALYSGLLTSRRRYVEGIVERDPTQKKFRKGWLARINDIRFHS